MKNHFEKHHVKASWKEENVKYIYWILGAIIFFILFDVFIVISSDLPLVTLFRKEALILYLNLLFIPLFTINVILLFKKNVGQYCDSSFKFTLLKVASMIIGVVISTGVVEYIAHLVEVVDDDYIGIGNFNLSIITTNFVTNVFFGFVIGLPVFSKQSSEDRGKMKLLEKERELSKAYELKIKSELDAIHAKINPHFLYNSLNSIVSLIHEDPHKAEKMVLSLSDLFRYSINSGENNFATIKQEIDLVRNYLEIEHVRFQDQLKIEIDIDEMVENTMIPKFLIQPLVENAIKHGTSKIAQGIIRLEIKEVNQCLQISVFDNGPYFPNNINSGYGLKSTVDKLDLLYKDDYSFKILNEPEKRIEIQLKINKNQDVKSI